MIDVGDVRFLDLNACFVARRTAAVGRDESMAQRAAVTAASGSTRPEAGVSGGTQSGDDNNDMQHVRC